MIELYYWPTPNGHKISIALEEMGLLYEIKSVNIGAGISSSQNFWPFHQIIECRQSSIMMALTASRSLSLNLVLYYYIWLKNRPVDANSYK